MSEKLTHSDDPCPSCGDHFSYIKRGKARTYCSDKCAAKASWRRFEKRLAKRLDSMGARMSPRMRTYL